MMIKIPFTTEWNVHTPTVYRYLEAEFVEAFFADGTLRLSSFERFSKHEDEQRLDAAEGEYTFVHLTQDQGGQTIYANGRITMNAFVLCATMYHSKSLMDAFKCTSYIRINDTTKFAAAVAKRLPGLRRGFEGPCLYQSKKTIQRDLGYLDPAQIKSKQDAERIVHNAMEQFPLFLKDATFLHQSEYRFLWDVFSHSEYIDLKVPEARQFCSEPNSLIE